MTATISLDELPKRVGKEVGLSQWRTVTQQMIDTFAEATDDHQWIHTDPERAAAETPFGGTIAHGFLTLSVLSPMAYEALPSIEGSTMAINYGFDRVRFAMPVKSGARIRARFTRGTSFHRSARSLRSIHWRSCEGHRGRAVA